MESSLFSVSPIATTFCLLPPEDRTPSIGKTTNQFSISIEDGNQSNNIERLSCLYKELVGKDNLYAGFGGLQHLLNKRSSRCDNNDSQGDFYDNSNSYDIIAITLYTQLS